MTQDLDPPPGSVGELASACVQYVHRSLQIELDYMPETLPILDHYLRESGRGASEEVLNLVAPAAGAYFGEVVRHAHRSRWSAPAADHARWRLHVLHPKVSFNPLGMAREALLGHDAEGWNAHFELGEGHAVALEALSGSHVPEDEYYSLSSRHEVLLQLLALIQRARASRVRDPSPLN